MDISYIKTVKGHHFTYRTRYANLDEVPVDELHLLEPCLYPEQKYYEIGLNWADPNKSNIIDFLINSGIGKKKSKNKNAAIYVDIDQLAEHVKEDVGHTIDVERVKNYSYSSDRIEIEELFNNFRNVRYRESSFAISDNAPKVKPSPPKSKEESYNFDDVVPELIDKIVSSLRIDEDILLIHTKFPKNYKQKQKLFETIDSLSLWHLLKSNNRIHQLMWKLPKVNGTTKQQKDLLKYLIENQIHLKI